MHVAHIPRPAAFVQVVNILRYEEKVPCKLDLQPAKRMVRWVGFDTAKRLAPGIVKAQNKAWIAGKTLRSGNIFDGMLLPQAAR